MKFKIGDKVKVVKNLVEGFEYAHIGDIGVITNLSKACYLITVKLNDGNIETFKESELELIKESKMDDKTYKGWEIVKMISEGELKEGTILKDDNDDKFTVFNNCLLSGAHNEFNSDYEAESSFLIMGEFTIVDTKKRYPFVEAFIAFEDGEEIEDKYGMCYRKLNSFTVEYKAKHMKKWEELHSDINIFSIDAIKGDWYINN